MVGRLSIAQPRGLRRVIGVLAARRPRAPGIGVPAGCRWDIDVVRLLGAGASNREIAAQLVISEHIAANHVRNSLIKIGADNRTQAAIYASAHGLL